jgi:hypothetical protein
LVSDTHKRKETQYEKVNHYRSGSDACCVHGCSAYAVTPKFEIPELPEVPEIKSDFSWIDFDSIFERWFSDHPIRIKSVRLG